MRYKGMHIPFDILSYRFVSAQIIDVNYEL